MPILLAHENCTSPGEPMCLVYFYTYFRGVFAELVGNTREVTIDAVVDTKNLKVFVGYAKRSDAKHKAYASTSTKCFVV